MRKALLLLLGLFVIVVGMAAAACGGDDDDTADKSATAKATAAAGAATTAAGRIADLKSFEYDMTIAGLGAAGVLGAPGAPGAADIGKLQAKGAYVAPDRASLVMSVAGQEIGVVVIGKDQWVKLGGTWLGPTPADGSAADSVLAIAFWDEGFQSEAGGLSCSGDKKKVNGIDTRHCTIDTKNLRDLLESLGDPSDDFGDFKDFKFDVWMAEDGNFPVRLEFSGKDAKTGDRIEVKLDLKNVNGNVKIEAPKS